MLLEYRCGSEKDIVYCTQSPHVVSALCGALASRVVDKCQAVTPLVGGEYSTATGRLLRDTYQPLHSVLAMLDVAKFADEEGKGEFGVWMQSSVVRMLHCRFSTECQGFGGGKIFFFKFTKSEHIR